MPLRLRWSLLAATTVIACSDAQGPAAPATQPVVWSRLDAGGLVTCGVATDGRGYCWGAGWSTGLDGVNISAPREVNRGLRWTVIEAGGSMACGLAVDGKTRCWGTAGTRTAVSPELLRGDPGLASISAGLSHACGLTRDGVAYCWGDGFRGQLGTGGVVYPATDSAMRVAGNLKFLTLRAGPESTCGVVVGGDVYCWGGSEVEGESSAPQLVQSGFGFASLAYGGNFGGRGEACAEDSSRALLCFGYQPHTLLSQPTPKVLVASGAGTLQFDVGGRWLSELGAQYQTHACVVGSANTVACWGSNAEGQLGDGTTTDRDSAASIPQLANVVQVTTGGVHSCAVTRTGAAYCWGQNREGQLGAGTFGAPLTTPQLVIGAAP